MDLEHIGIGVRTELMEQTLRFYQQVFGWSQIREHPGGIVFLRDGRGGCIEFFPRDATPINPPHHLAFRVASDFTSVVDALDAAGVEREEPRQTPVGDTVVYFRDPGGNYCQAIQRVEPLPP